MMKLIRKCLRILRYDLVKYNGKSKLPSDFEPLHQEIYQKVADRTMTSPERIYSLVQAVKYIEKHAIEGAIVECGVWKGGSMMAVAETLRYCGNLNRELYLYDTFEGMSEPTAYDKTFFGADASTILESDTNKERNLVWAYSSLETVQQGMASTHYPQDKVRYIKGKVEDTIPATLPGKIALLRLDTDWYESTLHEMIHLFPLLEKGGVLLLDDYGHWEGARKAVDEYIEQYQVKILLNRIDETGRIATKQ